MIVETPSDNYSPYAAFDIGKCDTYSHLWTMDLIISCEGGEEFCKCTFTENLMSQGFLTCDDVSKCPSECGVCASCMHSICNPPLPTSVVARGFRANPGLSLAAIATTILLVAFVVQMRKGSGDGILNESLMDENGIPYKKRDWRVLLGKNGLPTDRKFWKGKKSKVWLVPDLSTVPNKALFPDLLEKGEKVETAERSEPKKQKKSRNPVIVTSSNVSVQSSLSSRDGVGYTAPIRVNHYKKETGDDDSTTDYIAQRIKASQSYQ